MSQKIWYMRDDHTFRVIPLDVNEALQILEQEFDEGQCYGMLCTKSNLIDVNERHIHANGKNKKQEFLEQAKEWLEEVIPILQSKNNLGLPWRVGKKVRRIIYDSDNNLIGVMDKEKYAKLVVESVNKTLKGKKCLKR